MGWTMIRLWRLRIPSADSCSKKDTMSSLAPETVDRQT